MRVSHFDFYRFDDPREWVDAGLREVFARAGLKLVEWPERAEPLLPPPDLRLHLQHRRRRCTRGADLQRLRARGRGVAAMIRLAPRRAARLGSLVLLLGAAELAHGATIVAVRCGRRDDYTR